MALAALRVCKELNESNNEKAVHENLLGCLSAIERASEKVKSTIEEHGFSYKVIEQNEN